MVDSPGAWLWLSADELGLTDPDAGRRPRHADRPPVDWEVVKREVWNAVEIGNGATDPFDDDYSVDVDVAYGTEEHRVICAWLSSVHNAPNVHVVPDTGRVVLQNGRHRLWATSQFRPERLPVATLLRPDVVECTAVRTDQDRFARDMITRLRSQLALACGPGGQVIRSNPHYESAVISAITLINSNRHDRLPLPSSSF